MSARPAIAPGPGDLAGQRVLVVGGTSGIGLAVARLALEYGAGPTVVGSDPASCAAAGAELGPDASVVTLDMREEHEVERHFATHDPYDHVVVTAARLTTGEVRTLPVAEARASLDSKFWGSYLIARHARITAAGSLTLVSGAAARRPRAGRSVVAAACAALEALTRALAVELAPVRVNCVSPGLVDTPMLRAGLGTAEVPARVGRALVGAPAQVAFQILACAVNPYMTGTVLDLDGGLTSA